MHDGLRKPLEALTAAETRARARDYRMMAATVATTARVKEAFLRLARMLERRAAEKDAQDANRAHSDRATFATGYADGRSGVPGLRPKAALPFRTAYDAGYESGRLDAEVTATSPRTGSTADC